MYIIFIECGRADFAARSHSFFFSFKNFD